MNMNECRNRRRVLFCLPASWRASSGGTPPLKASKAPDRHSDAGIPHVCFAFQLSSVFALLVFDHTRLLLHTWQQVYAHSCTVSGRKKLGLSVHHSVFGDTLFSEHARARLNVFPASPVPGSRRVASSSSCEEILFAPFPGRALASAMKDDRPFLSTIVEIKTLLLHSWHISTKLLQSLRDCISAGCFEAILGSSSS